MAAAGKCRKRKRAARGKDEEAETRARDGPRRDVADKKRDVRELAMAGRFQEIKRRYGGKMMDKAKAYAEKQRAKHTPQSLARDILLRNGYAAADARGEPGTTASTAAEPVVAGAGRGRQGNESVERVQSELSTHSAPPQRPRVSVSPESLTADQLQLIERRRREALERRRRKDVLAACASASSVQQQFCQTLPTQPMLVRAPRAAGDFPADGSTRGAISSGNAANEAVGGFSAGAALGTGLTIADHYVHELDDDVHELGHDGSHLVPDGASQEARTVETPGVPDASREDMVHPGQQAVQPPLVVSISQELTAAVDIVMWEQQNEFLEDSASHPPVSVISVSDDDDADVPRFKLLPTPEETFQPNQPAETASTSSRAGMVPAVAGSTVASTTPAIRLDAIDTQYESAALNRGETWQGQPRHNVVEEAQRLKHSNSHTDTSARQPTTSRSSASIRNDAVPENRNLHDENAVEKLIEKHRLDNAFDTTLLQFIDMILS